MTAPLRRIDVNADAGEGCDDAELAPYVSSFNIACGAHAGDESTMRATLGRYFISRRNSGIGVS